MAQSFGDWSSANPFKGKKPIMYVPKSAPQEANDANLRSIKRILESTVVLTDQNQEWQCRYQTRRVGLVSRLDPGYDSSNSTRPKFTIVAGVEACTGKAFAEKGMLNIITGKSWPEVDFLTLEQELNAAIRWALAGSSERASTFRVCIGDMALGIKPRRVRQTLDVGSIVVMTHNCAKKNKKMLAKCITELLQFGRKIARHCVIGFQEVPKWDTQNLVHLGYSCRTAPDCDCAIVFPSAWHICDSRRHHRYIIILFKSFMVISLHMIWWFPEVPADLLNALNLDILDLMSKCVDNDVPILIAADTNMSFEPNCSFDESEPQSGRHYVTGPLALLGSHNAVDRRTFTMFCHALGLRAFNTWPWDDSDHKGNKFGTNTWFSRSNLGVSHQLDFVLGTSHFVAQARPLVASPDRRALWEQSDHAPVIAKCLLLEEDGGGISSNKDLEKIKWTFMKGWEAVNEQAFG